MANGSDEKHCYRGPFFVWHNKLDRGLLQQCDVKVLELEVKPFLSIFVH